MRLCIEDYISQRHKLNENSVDGENVVRDMKILIAELRKQRNKKHLLIQKLQALEKTREKGE